MKQLKQKNSLLYLFLLCIIACAIAVIVAISDNTTHTAFAATGEYDSSVQSSEVTQSATIVVFQKNGGIGGSILVTATYGEDMPEATAPTWEYHIFIGYFSEKEGGTQYYDQNMNSTHIWDITDEQYELFAHWETEHYTVYFDFEGGEGGTESVEVEYGADMPSGLTAPIKVGYDFIGYFSHPDGEGEQYYNDRMVTNKKWYFQIDGILYAKWENKKYTVILDSLGGEEIDTIQTYMMDMVLGYDAPTKVGYTFEGYYSQPNGQGTKYYDADMLSAHLWDIPEDKVRIYANYLENTYEIKLDANGGNLKVDGKIFASYKFIVLFSQDFNLDDYLPQKIGKIFGGWYSDDILYSGKVNKQTQNLILKASWEPRVKGEVYEMSNRLNSLLLNEVTNVTCVLPSSNFIEPCHIIIPAEASNVHIYANSYRSYNMYITIESRNSEINLYLENFSFTAPIKVMADGSYIPLAAITANTPYSLNLYAYGEVYIKGANGIRSSSGICYNANYAIKCQRLIIMHRDNLTIVGGSAGYEGCKAAYGIYSNYIRRPSNTNISGGYVYNIDAKVSPCNPDAVVETGENYD